MMLLQFSLLFLLLQYCFGKSEPFLVSLNSDETMESFYAYDIKFPPTERVRDLITNTYSFGDFNAFSGNFPPEIVKRLESCELVAEISRDVKFKGTVLKTQANAPRHLARVSRRAPFDFGQQYSYFYNSTAQGQDVNVYVIDSGVATKHPQFGGRAKFGKDFTGEGSGDSTGHGSHVAGVIGSKKYGIAKKCNIISIKVLNSANAGELSVVLAALEYAAKHRKRTGKPGVANLSIGEEFSGVINRAIRMANNTGLVVVAAAGNDGTDACTKSPASSRHAITVGAISDVDDRVASFSNWGKCVDLFAIGTNVVSVNSNDFNSPQTLEGTSFSAPVVSGLVANLLSEGVPPEKVKQVLLARSTKGRIPSDSLAGKSGTRNRIAHNGVSGKEAESQQGTQGSLRDPFSLFGLFYKT
ncbi:uncharacterized protein SPAPADRAFT_155574 [Spathaspora passalidarum NRRL Y-27907]|uniref:Peptidase S8/S53 domain-containing protein n=1 Tax=Spathaspora passalidarum (strain NRRL Y-27907 / 11-Y1) TaxID=619300 RepID=G3AS00_SPAPN|nr:uncharacterized protein SPAPADRAFT_155574 [Spathaspora passalidarum NRRL Y-27907]EGW31849.1 hypothetical protein SPAPADRAFT_155574 [Spathaspora passalidarum NRRL Y-27907]